MDTKLKQSRGFGFIRCCNYEDQKQLVGKKFVLHEREIRIQKPHSKDNEPTRLFVGRLSNQIKKSDLREYFEQFGEVVDVYYPEHNRGFGFVTLADSAVATAVLRMSHVLKNVNLVVNVAESKQTKQHEVLTFRPTLLKPDSKDRLHFDEQLEDRYPHSPTMLDTLERRLDSRSSPPYSTDKRFSDSSDPNYSFSPDMFNAMAHMMTSVAKAVQGGSKSDYWNPVRERSRPTSRHRDWGSGSGMRF